MSDLGGFMANTTCQYDPCPFVEGPHGVADHPVTIVKEVSDLKVECATCHGSGKTVRPVTGDTRHGITEWTDPDNCSDCDGRGWVVNPKAIEAFEAAAVDALAVGVMNNPKALQAFRDSPASFLTMIRAGLVAALEATE
jgi:DnaJ-class molecular chaperone